MSKLQRSLAALAVIVGLIGAAVLAVRASYGAFNRGYPLQATFARVNYGVEPGTQVEYRGMPVGKVTSLHLVDSQAHLQLSIDQGFKVPAGVTAVIRPRSIFGDPFVDLDFPAAPSGAYLSAGQRIDRTSVDSEFGDLIASAVPLLEKINGQDLATIIAELAKAGDNFGPNVRASIESGSQLASLYATTIQAQLQALDSFARFQSVFAPTASSLNAIAANSNIALPTLNAAQADFQRALDSLTPFADKLASFIEAERPDFDRLLDQGDNVVRLLTAREPQVEQVVSGLAKYLYKFAVGRGAEVLPNGTTFSYFKNFVLFADVNALVCGVLEQGGPAVAPVLQALSGSGSPFDCHPSAAAAPAQAAAAPPLSSQATAAAQALANGVAGAIATPQPPKPLTLQDLVNQVLGSP